MTDENYSPRENTYRIGFLGAGNMGVALIEGIIRAHLVKPETIVASCTRIVRDSRLALTGVGVTTSNLEVVQQSDIVIIAVKPAVIPSVLKEVLDAKQITAEEFQRKCFISIAAGVSIATLESYFQSAGVSGVSIIRVMPNTPCSVGLSASGYSAGAHATMAHKVACEAIFRAVGVIDEVPEKLMDAVTGLSGSGPAYVFMFIEALADGGVRMGLPRNVALRLAAQTVKGAASMCLESGQHPGVLKDQVCSPGGTTIAAVEALEEHGFRAAAMSAVVAATKRGAELREAAAANK